MSFACKSIVWMYLDGEVVTRVDELDQERKLCACLCVDLLSEQRAFILLCKFRDGLACERTFSNY